MRRVALASALVAALVMATTVSAGCSFNGNAFNIPLFEINVPQQVPSDPGLDGPRWWQFALCDKQPTSTTGCESIPPSYVIEINNNKDGCDVGFNNPSPLGWISNYGGANQQFTGQAQVANDRVANVTLICDPSVTGTPTSASTSVLAYPTGSFGSQVWHFDIRLNTAAVCGGGPGPNPNPNPGPSGGGGGKPEEKTSVVAILFVVFVFLAPVVYVGAFVGYNYFKLGKRGVSELLPHPEFWKDFPYLLLDGCKFVKNKFMQLIGKGDGSGTYGGSGEASYAKV